METEQLLDRIKQLEMKVEALRVIVRGLQVQVEDAEDKGVWQDDD